MGASPPFVGEETDFQRGQGMCLSPHGWQTVHLRVQHHQFDSKTIIFSRCVHAPEERQYLQNLNMLFGDTYVRAIMGTVTYTELRCQGGRGGTGEEPKTAFQVVWAPQECSFHIGLHR